MHRQRGYSLIEVTIALLILAIVITTTIVMFAERDRYLRDSSETILVWQTMWNESELWRRISWNDLEGQPPKFQTDTSLLKPLEPYETSVKVKLAEDDPNIKDVTLTIRWGWDKDKKLFKRNAHLALMRADTGGSNLW